MADANGRMRAAGTPVDAASADYVAARLEAAGYAVSIQEYPISIFQELGPAEPKQVAPIPTVYGDGVDHDLMQYSASGDVTAPVTAVDLDLGPRHASTSGCEPADLAGFPAGHIALIQRGACTFRLKAENAYAAGAVGVIVFNQGNTPERDGLLSGALSSDFTVDIPVIGTTYALGEDFASTPGLVARLAASTLREFATTANVIAESAYGDSANVVIAGAYLNFASGSPGISDNGSGVAALLEVAELMGRVETYNRVRFAFWGSRFGTTRGSDYYVSNLTEEEIGHIALDLNFDVIGSPNYVRFV